MPRKCGCASGSCTCAIISSDNSILVSGTGTVDNPYNLRAGGIDLTGRLDVEDSSSIDLVLTGQGTQADPYVLTAIATLSLGDLTNVDTSDTTVGYVLARQGDGSFALVPPATPAEGVIVTDSSIDGDGSAGAPLSVHDYDRIAWLEGADGTPNLGNLRLGEGGDTTRYGYFLDRYFVDAPDYDLDASVQLSAEIGSSVDTYGVGGPLGVPHLRAEITDDTGAGAGQFRFFRDGRTLINRVEGGLAHHGYLPVAMYGERICISGDGSSQRSVDISFPSGYFTELPTVTATMNKTLTAEGLYAVRIDNLTTSGCTVILQRMDGGFSVLHCIGLVAVQMLPGS